MAQQGKKKEAVPKPMSAMERLSLRVSSMINHPIAQERREVTIHRLDTDEEMEWGEMMGLISETDGISTALNEDGSVTLKWEAPEDDDRPKTLEDAFEREEVAPF